MLRTVSCSLSPSSPCPLLVSSTVYSLTVHTLPLTPSCLHKLVTVVLRCQERRRTQGHSAPPTQQAASRSPSSSLHSSHLMSASSPAGCGLTHHTLTRTQRPDTHLLRPHYVSCSAGNSSYCFLFPAAVHKHQVSIFSPALCLQSFKKLFFF